MSKRLATVYEFYNYIKDLKEKVIFMMLPLLLCGPIIRRVEPDKVYLWVALSQPYEINTEIFTIKPINVETPYMYEPINHHTETNTMQLGEQLYIKLIKITPKNGLFPTQTLLGYNLIFNSHSRSFDLGSLQLLTPNSPHNIVYGSLKYPTFYIHDGSNSNLLYGSCRKFHGKGLDSLTSGDLLLQDVYHQIDKRPNSLFLLGDQIYADDVADPLFPILSTLSKALIGNQQKNLVDIEPGLVKDPFQKSIDRIHGRQLIMENLCGFTSNHADNHLIRLEEYATMYLLSWSPELWHVVQEKNLLATYSETVKNRDFAYSQEELEELQLESNYVEQVEALRNSISTISNIRRLMANVPTYMMFDDHEITDDWNISEEWTERVRKLPLGKHVIANALTSYWAFQGWGNAPATFNQDFLKTIFDYIKSNHANLLPHEKWIQLIWNFADWSYVAPTQPKTVVLDTRTQRSFEFVPHPSEFGEQFAENKQGPILISPKGWELISLKLAESGWKEKEPLIIVSPSPVYGLGLIESFLFDYVYPFKFLGVPMDTTLDFEAWKYNGKGFTSFLQTVSKWNPSHCFILSGDVHLASAVKSHVNFPDGPPLHIFQFTSSPLHNISYNDLWGNLVKVALWLNSRKRRKYNINRYYDSRNQIIEETEKSQLPSSYVWKDQVSYLALENQSLVEIENNLGHLTISPKVVKNTLLNYDGFQLQRKNFEFINLQDREKFT
jgi:hypothetical protein